MISDSQGWRGVADPVRRVGRVVEYHATIGSTNDRARAALASGTGDGLAVVADLQTAGRGRQGRTWVSPAGCNLAVSVAVRPHLRSERAGLLGLAAAVAARDACGAMLPRDTLAIRWPNDVVSAEGLKVAGLLLETSLDGTAIADAVIGIGINVNWRRAEMPAELAARAVSLADLADQQLDRVALLDLLLRHLDAELAALEAGDSPVPRFRDASALDGRWVTVDVGSSRLDGRVQGIADDGALQLELDGRLEALSIGEVVSVRDMPPSEVVA